MLPEITILEISLLLKWLKSFQNDQRYPLIDFGSNIACSGVAFNCKKRNELIPTTYHYRDVI